MDGPYVIEHGDVWRVAPGKRLANGFSSNKTHVCDGTAELAVAMTDDVMLKHGSAEAVDDWVSKKAAGIDVTVFRFPVSPETVRELNLCAENTTRAAHIVANLTRIGAETPTLADLPRYPRF